MYVCVCTLRAFTMNVIYQMRDSNVVVCHTGLSQLAITFIPVQP